MVEAATAGSIQRFRPIFMTLLVASLGLVPCVYVWIARDGDIHVDDSVK